MGIMLKCNMCGKEESDPFDVDDECICGGHFYDNTLRFQWESRCKVAEECVNHFIDVIKQNKLRVNYSNWHEYNNWQSEVQSMEVEK